jgi:hypothetical protein
MSVYPYIIDPEVYPWAIVLKDNWKIIKQEYDSFCSYVKENAGGNKITRLVKLNEQAQYSFPVEVIQESIKVFNLEGQEIEYNLARQVSESEVSTKANTALQIEKSIDVLTVSGYEDKDVQVKFATNPFVNFLEDIYNGTWKTFCLYTFGYLNKEVESHFPETLKLLRNIPGLETAMYSLLEPGTHITPHRGYSKNILRCHVGLTPKEDAYLRVGEIQLTWDEGSVFIFDDTEEHEVLHSGNNPRLAFIIDFKRDITAPPDYPEYVNTRIVDMRLTGNNYRR